MMIDSNLDSYILQKIESKFLNKFYVYKHWAVIHMAFLFE